MVSMPTTFWERIDWGDPADDPFSLGLLQVPTKFRKGWATQQSKAIPACNEEWLSRSLNSKSVPTADLADILPYNSEFRESLPSKMRRRYPLRRDYLKLFRKLGRTLLQSAFENWLSTVRDLIQVHFQDVFDIAVANPDRTCDDDPQEFAYQFLDTLIEDVVVNKVDGLASDHFLKHFFYNGNTRREEAHILVLLRHLVRSSLMMHIMELSSTAQIELAKRDWTKATKTKSLITRQSQVVPAPDEAGSAPALAQQAQVAAAPDKAGSADVLRLRHLEEPPANVSVRVTVMKIFPELKKAVLDARYFVVGEQKKNNHPSTHDISQKFPLLADAEESEIEKYVFRREGTPHKAALQMIEKICRLPLDTIKRYTHPMRKDKSSRETVRRRERAKE
jgi:hypothetical protein